MVVWLQAYERAIISKHIELKHNVPHSPATPAGLADLQPMPELEAILAEFRTQFNLTIVYEAV